jgi:hypothetical protein
VVQTEAHLRVLPILAVRAVSVRIVHAAVEASANILANRFDMFWAWDRNVLGAAFIVRLEAHLRLRRISEVKTKTNLWIVPGLAI